MKTRFAIGRCCCHGTEPCGRCQRGTTPESIEVTLAGWHSLTGGGCDYGECDGINATYVLPYTGADSCKWYDEFTPTCDERLTIEVNLDCDGLSYYLRARVVLYHIIGGFGIWDQDARYEKALGSSKPDCGTFNEALDLVINMGGMCDVTGSTVMVVS